MEIWANNATSTLASGISNVATTLTVATGEGVRFPAIGVSTEDQFWATLENNAGTREIVRVIGRSGDVFTLLRGQQGTTAVAWLTGDSIESRLTADTLNVPEWGANRSVIQYATDFANVLNGTPFVSTLVGTGAAIASTGAETGSTFGVVNLATGTTATGSAGFITSATWLHTTSGEIKFDSRVRVPTLSDGTNTFVARVGFIDSSTADATDGVYFEYIHSTSVNWLACAANGATRTKSSTGIAVSAGAMVRLSAIVNAAGTSVDYFINNVYGATVTTNIPVISAVFGAGASIVKSVGLTSRTFDLDSFFYRIRLTTPR